eukprot:Selendium_serpulae@DN41_c0_g1_i1.p1
MTTLEHPLPPTPNYGLPRTPAISAPTPSSLKRLPIERLPIDLSCLKRVPAGPPSARHGPSGHAPQMSERLILANSHSSSSPPVDGFGGSTPPSVTGQSSSSRSFSKGGQSPSVHAPAMGEANTGTTSAPIAVVSKPIIRNDILHQILQQRKNGLHYGHQSQHAPAPPPPVGCHASQSVVPVAEGNFKELRSTEPPQSSPSPSTPSSNVNNHHFSQLGVLQHHVVAAPPPPAKNKTGHPSARGSHGAWTSRTSNQTRAIAPPSPRRYR